MAEKLSQNEIERRINDFAIENDFLRRQFMAIVENSMDAILLTAPDGRIFSANRAACDLYQMTEEELIARGRNAVIDPEDDRLAKALTQRAQTGRFRGELNQIKKDGTVFPAEVSSAIFRDAAGLEFTSMIVRDLTEQKQTEADLLTKVQLLESMNTAIEDAVFVVSMDSKIVGMNQAAEELFGYASDELLGRSTEVLHIDYNHFNAFEKAIDKAFKNNEKVHFSFKIKTKGGKILPTDHTVSIIRDHSGSLIGMVSVVRDLSRIAELEDKLTDTRFKLNLVTDTIDDVIWMSTAGVGKMLYISAAYETLWERSRESLYQNPRSFMDAVHPEDRDRLAEIVAASHSTLHSYECEYRIVRKNGEVRWIHERGFPVSAIPERIMTGICTDITDRKQTEAMLLASERRYLAVLENQTDLIGRFKSDGTLVFVNEAFCKFLGKDRDDLIGRKWQPLPHQDDLPEIQRRLKRLSPQNPVVVIENRNWDADGNLRWMQFVNRGFYNDSGQLLEIQFVARDITELKENEQLLRDRETELRKKSEELTKVNTALEVLLERRNRQIDELKETIYRNFIKLILPDLNSLKKRAEKEINKKSISLVIENLENLLSPTTDLMTSEKFALTNTEIRVAAMIRSGMTSAQIADQLRVSLNTVGFHRKNIRKKLGIQKSGKAFAQHLKQLG